MTSGTAVCYSLQLNYKHMLTAYNIKKTRMSN